MTQVGRRSIKCVNDELIALFFSVALKYKGMNTKTKERNYPTGIDFYL